MRIKKVLCVLALLTIAFTYACKRATPTTQPAKPVASPTADGPAALPNAGFKAELSLIEPPLRMRAGEKVTVRVKIKNASDVMWWSRGAAVNTRADNKFYLAAGDRWLKADGSLLTSMDGRIGIGKDLRPGESTEVPLLITAPKDPGEYTLEVDLVQEGVAWFADKGSPTTKAKISVVK